MYIYLYLDLSSRNLSRVKTEISDNDKEDLYIHKSCVCVCLPEDTAEGLSKKRSVIKVYRNEIHIQTWKIKMLFFFPYKNVHFKNKNLDTFLLCKLTFLLIKKKKKRQNRIEKETHERRKKTNPILINRLPLVKTAINCLAFVMWFQLLSPQTPH